MTRAPTRPAGAARVRWTDCGPHAFVAEIGGAVVTVSRDNDHDVLRYPWNVRVAEARWFHETACTSERAAKRAAVALARRLAARAAGARA